MTRPTKKKPTKIDALKKSKVPLKQPKAGRPLSAATIAKQDLAFLKQEHLLDDVERLIEQQQRRKIDEGVKEIVVPYTPSSHQLEVHNLIHDHRFGVVVVHRGWGKTWLAANELIRRAWACTAPQGGKFIYVAPEKLQAKKIVWKEMKYFVRDLPHTINEAELIITFPNGSSVELAGADNPDRLRGMHPHFVVLDEVAQMPKDTWYEAVYPALRANKGGALFIGTPKGDNLFKDLFLHAGEAKGWFGYKKTILDTNVASDEEIEELRKTMPENKFEQEYMCSFEAATQGSFYDYLFASPDLSLTGDVAWDPDQPVMTAWDLGISDPTAVWFIQQDKFDSSLYRVIDFYEESHPDFMLHLKAVLNKPYLYSYHFMPHDINKRVGLGTLTRYELCRRNGMEVRIASKEIGISEGITMVQRLIPKCRFDITKAGRGIAHLKQYTAKQNRMTGEFAQEANHDRHSHAADAFRYLAVGLRKSHGSDAKHLAYADASYDYFSLEKSGRGYQHEADSEYDPFEY